MSVQDRVKVKVPNLSGFDKSFKNILTTKVGTLTPLLCKYVMPGAKGSLKLSISAALPPLASDTFMRANLKVEAFAVPMRLLYGGFESYLAKKNIYDPRTSSMTTAEIPILQYLNSSTEQGYVGPGTLADYLGLRIDASKYTTSSVCRYNIFPFLAYYRCVDDWYRNSKIHNPFFVPPIHKNITAGTDHGLSYLPYDSDSGNFFFQFGDSFVNGTKFGHLEQRNYGADYFTVALFGAQQGNPQGVSTSGGSYTIASLRTANSLQQFAERSGYAGNRLQDYVYAHYGANLASGIADRAILLGSASYPVYSKGVEANAGVTATNNPFTSVGVNYGRGVASGSDFVCKFEINEPSYLLVMVSLVPEANYAHGIDHEFYILNAAGAQVDLPDPILENTGNEPIYRNELTGDPDTAAMSVFGYVPKNTWYKTNVNTVHGLLRSGQSLDSFVAQRTFSGSPSLNGTFLKVNITDLNNVTAVTADLANYGCWIDSFIDLRVVEPLVDNAIPSLQDPAYEHGKTVVLSQKHDI